MEYRGGLAIRKFWHDKHLKKMNFKQRQIVLRYNEKNKIKLGQFKVRWLGPFRILEIKENGAIKLSTLDNTPIRDLVNGSKLKAYEERNKQETN